MICADSAMLLFVLSRAASTSAAIANLSSITRSTSCSRCTRIACFSAFFSFIFFSLSLSSSHCARSETHMASRTALRACAALFLFKLFTAEWISFSFDRAHCFSLPIAAATLNDLAFRLFSSTSDAFGFSPVSFCVHLFNAEQYCLSIRTSNVFAATLASRPSPIRALDSAIFLFAFFASDSNALPAYALAWLDRARYTCASRRKRSRGGNRWRMTATTPSVTCSIACTASFE
mmetsp:Transcript_22732/g.57899  ORF Transcript_22732/g.57899 Transcript_22732/m.57899 type:complete len:233 (-) Transcript_22732:646-1344(-)